MHVHALSASHRRRSRSARSNFLSERLALVEEGISEPSEYREPGSRARMEYRLTDTGPHLMYILLELRQWVIATRPIQRVRPWSLSTSRAAAICTSPFACSNGHIVTEPDETFS